MTLYELAQRFVGVKEITGANDNPLIVWMSQLSNPATADDETPWCSAFVNMCAWILRLPRSKSNAARSWLKVGIPIALPDAEVGDVVILSRGTSPTAGHVGFFAAHEGDSVLLLAGNQNNEVNISVFPIGRILGIRRLT